MSADVEALEAWVDLASERSPDGLRTRIVTALAALGSAKAAILFGLDQTGAHLIPVAAWPGYLSPPSFDTTSRRGDHPVCLILNAGASVWEENASSMLAGLRLVLFPEEHFSRILIVPSVLDGHASSPFSLVLLFERDRLPAPDLIRRLELLMRLSANQIRLVTDLHASLSTSAALTRSIEQASEDRDQIRRVLPEVLSERILGASAKMQSLREVVVRYAPFDLNVLIRGEAGTGKELVAREMHGLSGRHAAPFIAATLAGLPERAIETELFGQDDDPSASWKPGLIGAAHGGTLFLDEIADIPVAIQGRLLQTIQDKRFRPSGSAADRDVDLRIMASTRHDPRRMIDEGKLRQELYYRLNQIRIDVPALREREDDVLLLARHFLRASAGQIGATKHFSAEAEAWLFAHDFPGNVRELQALIERAGILSGADPAISRADLSDERAENIPRMHYLTDGGLKETCDRFERAVILDVYRQMNGNRRLVAERLGVPLRTLADKLRRHGLNEFDDKRVMDHA